MMMLRRITLICALLFIGIVILMAVFPFLFSSHSPTAIDLGHEYAPFSAEHPLGQGENGIDLLSQIVHGARFSLSIAFIVVSTTVILGVMLGMSAGYFGGMMNQFISAVIDIIFAFPGILLSVALAAVLGPGIKNVVLLLSLTGWTSFARLTRAETLKLRQREFIQAALALGARPRRIFFRHLLPNLAPLITVQATFAMASVIMIESSLSFLGLGVPLGTPTWGGLLAMGKNALATAWHVSLVPGATLMLLILSFNILGDWLRDFLDPQQRIQTVSAD